MKQPSLQSQASRRSTLLVFLVLIPAVTAWTLAHGALASSAAPASNEPGKTIWLPLIIRTTGYKASFCFDPTRPVTSIIGQQYEQYHSGSEPLPANATVHAETAVWVHIDDHPVVVEGGPDICFLGGTVLGNYPYSTDWETMHGTTGMSFRSTGRTTLENVRIHNYGDGINFSRGPASYSFHIIGAHLTHIRDDCVQNDYMYSGLIEDSLFDGCYTAFSSQDKDAGGNDGSQNVWEIRDSLIWLEPMEKVYQDKGLIPGHGKFFKWNKDNDKSPRLSLHNNIFRADQPANSSTGFELPAGKLVSCSNNIFVWLGEGAFPDPLPWTFDGKPCFTVITDRSVWDNAVQEWKSRHK